MKGKVKSQEYQSDDVSSTSLQNSQVERLKRKAALLLQYRSNKELNTLSPSHYYSSTRDQALSNSFPATIKDIYFLYTGMASHS